MARRDFVMRGVPHYSPVLKRETNHSLSSPALTWLRKASFLSIKARSTKKRCAPYGQTFSFWSTVREVRTNVLKADFTNH